MSGKQGGDPAKLAKALVTILDEEPPPLRWVAGADAVATVEQKANELLTQVDAYRDLSSSLAIDELEPGEAEHSPGTTVMDPERRHLETSRSRGRARVSPGRSTRFWAGGEQLPVSLGDDFDVAVDHSYRGLVVDRVRRHR